MNDTEPKWEDIVWDMNKVELRKLAVELISYMNELGADSPVTVINGEICWRASGVTLV